MHRTYFTLAIVAGALRRALAGARFVEAWSQERGTLRARFISSGEETDLRFDSDPSIGTLFLERPSARAKRNTISFFETLAGDAVRDAVIADRERAIDMIFESGATLAFRFYGSAGANAILFGADGSIVESFRSRGSVEIVPVSGILPDRPDAPRLEALLGKTLRDEAKARGGANAETALAAECLSVVAVSLSSPSSLRSFFLYSNPELGRAIFSLLPLQICSAWQCRTFDNIFEALKSWIVSRGSLSGFALARSEAIAKVRGVLDSAQRSLTAVERELNAEERTAEWTRIGQWLLAHAHEIPRGAARVEAELGNDESPVAVKLDPALSVAVNANGYFERAKRTRAAREELTKRKARFDREIARASAKLEAVEAAVDVKAIRLLMNETRSSPSRSRDKAASGPRTRRYIVDGGFEVLVGRSAKENDELTFHVARQCDLWFHVRGMEGAHVILRVPPGGDRPPARAIREAAALAAFHSKAKTAGLVPVAYVERKYVRKPKGAPPGTVAMMREEVIMVQPREMAEADDE